MGTTSTERWRILGGARELKTLKALAKAGTPNRNRSPRKPRGRTGGRGFSRRPCGAGHLLQSGEALREARRKK